MAHSRAPLALSILLAACGLAGCAADASDPVDPGAADEQIGEADLAFGEATCTTVPATWTSNVVWPPSYIGPEAAATTGNYGSPSCTHAFVVDYANGTNYSSFIAVKPYSAPTSAGICNLTHVHAKTYEKVNGVYQPYQETYLHGVWNGVECTYQPDAGYGTLHLSTNPTRVIAQAYEYFCLLGSCGNAYVGVSIRAGTNQTP